jgi:pimeloyl-ACP methyl ester carboxylesterase
MQAGGVIMPYARNAGIRIYYEVEGVGPPLVLHHGSFASGADWRDLGYTEQLKHRNRLVLMDARGHGASDKPHDPAAYDMALRVSDVTSVLDDLQIERANFFGYSMGGWIGFGLAKHAPTRFRSLILGGAHPYAERVQGFRDALAGGMTTFISLLKQAYGSFMTQDMLARHEANDLEALSALSQDRIDLFNGLPTMTMPCLLFVGEDDPRLSGVRECARSIPDAKFFSVPGCGHAATLGRNDLVLPHVTAFLENVH